jgi:hypothetical protein
MADGTVFRGVRHGTPSESAMSTVWNLTRMSSMVPDIAAHLVPMEDRRTVRSYYSTRAVCCRVLVIPSGTCPMTMQSTKRMLPISISSDSEPSKNL